MVKPYVGDEVRFRGRWNSFEGQRGRVVKSEPHLMIRVQGDTHAMRFRDDEVEVVGDAGDAINMTGAE
jgi:hypothetical protein